MQYGQSRPGGSLRLVEADPARDLLAVLIGDTRGRPDPGQPNTVVLLVHGFDGNAMVWRSTVTRLAGRGVESIAPDLRGRGGSARLPSGTGMVDHVEDLGRTLDELGVDQVVAVGHGWGGAVVDAFHHAAPDRVAASVSVDDAHRRLLAAESSGSYRDRDVGRSRWLGLAQYSTCDREELIAAADHGLESSDGKIRDRLDEATLAADRHELRSAPGVAGATEHIRTATLLAVDSALDGGRLLTDLPLVDHQSILFSPTGVDAIVASIDRSIVRARSR